MRSSGNLRRLLAPRSIAVVGANQNLPMSNNAVRPMLDAGLDLHLVNPRRDEVYGRPALDTLADVGKPVDAVLALVNAERSIDVVAEAASLGCGGVVAIAGGFGEVGPAGASLEARLADAAGDLAVVGPNCSGFLNVPERVRCFSGGALTLQPGGVAVVSQSGFLVRSALAAGKDRQLGFSYAVSSGNETVCDLVDYIDLLVDDDRTRAICLVIETIRRPEAFFAAAARALETGTPIVALKLGRSDRSRDIMRSHTGAIADESWVYDVALRQAGIAVAADVDDLLDRVQLFDQVPPDRWKRVDRAAVVTTSGGVAALAADVCAEESIELPELTGLGPWLEERIPGTGSPNPLDLTGFLVGRTDVVEELFARYAEEADIDALILCWWAGAEDEAWAAALMEPYARVAKASPPSVMAVGPIEATSLGDWSRRLRDDGVSTGRGLRSLLRACATMSGFVDGPRRQVGAGPAPGPTIDRPTDVVAVPGFPGGLLGFGSAMALLRAVGIPVAPYVIVGDGPVDLSAVAGLGDRVVVKLADVPHRSELGAVRVGVAVNEVPAVVDELRMLARRGGHPTDVVVQALVDGSGEAFAGFEGQTGLGPVLVFGLGGIFVELVRQVSGRMLPVTDEALADLLDEAGGDTVFAGLRGQAPWSREALLPVLRGVADLGLRSRSWLASLDLNPVMCGPDGAVVVDAALVVR